MSQKIIIVIDDVYCCNKNLLDLSLKILDESSCEEYNEYSMTYEMIRSILLCSSNKDYLQSVKNYFIEKEVNPRYYLLNHDKHESDDIMANNLILCKKLLDKLFSETYVYRPSIIMCTSDKLKCEKLVNIIFSKNYKNIQII
jgi:hypothetical protein